MLTHNQYAENQRLDGRGNGTVIKPRLAGEFLPGERNREEIESAVNSILLGIGEDPHREGLLKTPNRVARMYNELTAGYHVDAEKLINGAGVTLFL